MNHIGNFSVEGAPRGWKIEQKNGRTALNPNASIFRSKLRDAARKTFPKAKTLSVAKEFELVIHLYQYYDKDFNTPGKSEQIPDIDHIETLVMNALEGIIYVTDIQVASLSAHRWHCKEDEERIQVNIYEI